MRALLTTEHAPLASRLRTFLPGFALERVPAATALAQGGRPRRAVSKQDLHADDMLPE
jgi:hypothetical protein